MRSDNLYQLPNDLTAPADDGESDHLPGLILPSVLLPSTRGRWVDLGEATDHLRVVYCYPLTGAPGSDPPGGLDAWNRIPGARGCTPQSMAFRDSFREFQASGTELFGLSTQSSDYQREVVARLGLPFELLSDESLALTRAIRLPTFEVASMTLLKRLSFVIKSGCIVKVFYPVFPPDKSAEEVIGWLSRNPLRAN